MSQSNADINDLFDESPPASLVDRFLVLVRDLDLPVLQAGILRDIAERQKNNASTDGDVNRLIEYVQIYALGAEDRTRHASVVHGNNGPVCSGATPK